MTVDFFAQNQVVDRPRLFTTDERIEQWMPLVRSLARRSAAKCSGYLDPEDLESLGMCAVWRACEDYNPDRGANFTTFVHLYVRHCMTACRLSVGGSRRIPHWMTMAEIVRPEDGVQLSIAEEILPHGMPSAEEMLEKKRWYAPLYDALGTLTEIQRIVIERRFFWDETLLEIGQSVSLSRERIRQIEAETLALMRRSLEKRGNGPDAGRSPAMPAAARPYDFEAERRARRDADIQESEAARERVRKAKQRKAERERFVGLRGLAEVRAINSGRLAAARGA